MNEWIIYVNKMNIPFLNFRDPAECQYKGVFAVLQVLNIK